MWRSALHYLGLGPDDEYEEYEGEDDARRRPPPPEPRDEREPVAVAPRPAPPVSSRPQPAARPTPPTRGRAAPAPPEVPEASTVRTLPSSSGGEPSAPKPKPVVRAVQASAKPHVVAPRHFNNAQEVADKYKASQPVILNLQEVDRELSRRLIDFCSGLCYGLGGHMEKVASHVYLLTPNNVEVSAEERRRLHERGLHDA
ncbi:MAG: cell division protein SepF [Acidimicrobiales bacterium]|nr:cell division protein SepF [Acidimicrobiales bacterium]